MPKSGNLMRIYNNNQVKPPKDIVFVLDFSESMEGGNRKKHAINAFLKIFDDYLKAEVKS